MKDSPFDRGRPHDARECLFGGRGRVHVWELLPEPNAPFGAVLACELEADASVGPHVQEHFSEIVVALEGSASARVNDVCHALTPGAVVELPVGHVLALENTSKQAPFRYLIVKATPGARASGSSSPRATEPSDS